MSEPDLDLETRIDDAALRLWNATTREDRILWRDALERLVKQRTAERVEQERGLA